jgi:peroxiredoxin family protein
MSHGDHEELSPALERRLAAMVEAEVARRVVPIEAQLADARARLAEVERRAPSDRASILVFSGDLDHLLSAFIIATSAAAMGLQASMYFTFWGLVALKKTTIFAGKSVPERLLALMLPGGPADVGPSRFAMLGGGRVMFERLMRTRNVESLPGLIAVARELGVKLIACQMAMDVMGVRREELLDGIEFGGAITYMSEAMDSRVTLFI